MSLSHQDMLSAAQNAYASGARFDAFMMLRKLVQAEPKFRTQWDDVATLARRLGDYPMAIHASEKLLAMDPESLKRRIALADAMSGAGRVDLAYNIMISSMGAKETSAEALWRLAVFAMQTGLLDDAEKALRMVLKNAPDFAPAWELLAAMARTSDADGVAIKAMCEAAADDRTPTSERIFRALGHHAHARQAYSSAAAAYMEAASRAKPVDSAATVKNYIDQVDAVVGGYDAKTFEDLKGDGGAPTQMPVFVLGLPRSGKAFLEQILATHPRIIGGGPMPIMGLALSELAPYTAGAVKDYLDKSGSNFTRLGNGYEGLMKERFGDIQIQHLTDASSGLERAVGAIALAMPKARFIYIARKDEDLALSCFRHEIGANHAWSHSFDEIAAHRSAHQKLMSHWQSLLGDRILSVAYEDLVLSPEAELGKVCSHIGVDYRADMQFFHENKRPIRSPYGFKARQPLNYDGLNVAKNYEAHFSGRSNH